MLHPSPFFSRQAARRWSLVAIVPVMAVLSVKADDGAALTKAQPDPNTVTPPVTTIQTTASGDSSASGLVPHAGALDLRDTGAGETRLASSTAPSGSELPASSTPPATANAMVNLINLLVSQNVIKKEAGERLITQAEQEADAVHAQIASSQAAADRALTVQTAQPTVSPPPNANANDEGLHVAYVPEIVKNQIRDEVKEDVLKQERDENWGVRNDTPDWVKRFRVAGDIRTRYEGDFYPSGNSIGSFTNFNAINTGSGFVIGSSLFPQYNVDQDRNRIRLRARIGAEIDLTHGFTVGLRLGTGADNSPVTENQTLGLANSGQGGNFAKYAVWLDRAFIKYELNTQMEQGLSFTVGRFDNPFFHTSMIWSDDLGFDGAEVQARYKVADGVMPFFVAGAFPVFNTDLNFSSAESAKFASEDKYLLASQIGTTWSIDKDFSLKVAAAYYYFADVEGKVSDVITSDALPGNTDDSRPSFAQNGNTYIALRNYQDPTNPNHTGESQYFGLATPFHEFALTSQLDYSGFDPFHLWLTGEFVKNLAFSRQHILENGSPNFPGPFNNLNDAKDPTSFVGGDTGWIVKLNLGKVALQQLWDWNVVLSYRYVESDATVDGFTESDFGGGLAGTNLKGYTIGGNLAFSPQVSAGIRWMSANSIAGPAYKSDLIQVDLNAKF